MRGFLLVLGALRIVAGLALAAFSWRAGVPSLVVASLFLALGLFTRLSTIAVLVLLFMHWPREHGFLFIPIFLSFGSGGNRLSIDRLFRILRGKERADPPRAREPRANALDVYYDGECVFCRRSVECLRALDLLGFLRLRDFRAERGEGIDPERAEKELLLRLRDGRVLGGFDAFRAMAPYLPLTFPLVPFLHLPGVAWIGRKAYAWVADHRYLFMGRASDCEGGSCTLPRD